MSGFGKRSGRTTKDAKTDAREDEEERGVKMGDGKSRNRGHLGTFWDIWGAMVLGRGRKMGARRPRDE